jgi:hypothetical protein
LFATQLLAIYVLLRSFGDFCSMFSINVIVGSHVEGMKGTVPGPENFMHLL